MATETDQVRALQQAILERARELAEEHIAQGELTRSKVIGDMRDKLNVMEQKELLAAKLQSDREYDRLVQASELRIQAELDRNRWGLVQAVVDKLQKQLAALREDQQAYRKILIALLGNGAVRIGQSKLVASISNDDLSLFHDQWEEIVQEACGEDITVRLAPEACDCSGGVRLVSTQGDVMLDNTFEGILDRRQLALQRVIFERLFSTATTKGTVFDG